MVVEVPKEETQNLPITPGPVALFGRDMLYGPNGVDS